jgi:hypothetical protein
MGNPGRLEIGLDVMKSVVACLPLRKLKVGFNSLVFYGSDGSLDRCDTYD